MFASIRGYKLRSASADKLGALVDAEFADQLAAQPGFVWYAFLDCGEGTALSISVFREPGQAAGSRELARRWTAERLGDFDLTLTAAAHGAIPVSRASPRLLEPAPGRFARVRRYQLGAGELGEIVWRIVDAGLAERIAGLDGFIAYFVFASADDDLVSVSVFADRDAAYRSDEVARVFVRDELANLQIKRADAIGGGEIVVDRVTDALLEPIHA